MSRNIWLTAVAMAMALASAPVVTAGEDPAQAFLKRQGLRKIGNHYVLPAERDLAQQIRLLEPLQKELTEAARQDELIDKQVESNDRLIEAAIAERRRLSMMLLRNIPLEEKVRIAARMAELDDRIALLRARADGPGNNRRTRSHLGDLKEQYSQRLLELRALVNQTLAQYAALAENERVSAALTSASEARGKDLLIGPSPRFKRLIEKLDKLEGAIFRSKIAMQPDGNVYWVDTIINERFTRSMVLDTGASLVCIPQALADEVGLRPDPGAATIRMQLADGTTVDAKRMILDSLRVGNCVVKNVECVVLGPEAADAPPLLGGSFLRNFTYKINPDNNMLTLTKVVAPSG